MGATEEVKHIYDLAKALMKSKEPYYGDSWRREGLGGAINSIFRKASGLEYMFRTGLLTEEKDRVKYKEDLLDQINYCTLAYKHLELIEEVGRNKTGGS